jgi:ribonuclease P protein component
VSDSAVSENTVSDSTTSGSAADGSVTGSPALTARTGPPRAGFVVSKAVGGAVVRNQVKRRLRHLVAARLDALPPGSTLVVRALPAAADADAAALAADLDAALRRSAGGPGTAKAPRRR